MSISPINFNGMIQNTTEAANTRVHEESKTSVQQAAVTVEISKKEEAQKRQVNNPEDTRQKDQRYDREGNGKGYRGPQTKMLKKKSDGKKEEEGKVFVKPTSTFDIKI